MNKENNKKSIKKKSGTANRGLDFEDLIEDVCTQLAKDSIALIHKVPTEWKVLRKYNPKKRQSEIFNAFPVSESRFVDFVGIAKGYPLALEAKETKELTRFPFANIKDTQWDFFKLWTKLNGKGYYIIRFTEHKKIFLVDCIKFQECHDNIGRKSAPYEWFLDNAIELDYDKINFIDYI